MGASMALAGLAGCTKQPDEPIYPYVKAPEDLLLGKPMYFATRESVAHRRGSAAGQERSSSAPSRSTAIPITPTTTAPPMSSRRVRCSISTIPTARSMSPSKARTASGPSSRRHSATRWLAPKTAPASTSSQPTITSPTLARQWKAVQAAYPKAKLVQYDPAIAGTFLAKGYNVQYDLSAADVIVSLDADFLSGASYPGFHKLVARLREAPQRSRQRHEPALHHREHADHDRHEGGASPRPARQRNSRIRRRAGCSSRRFRCQRSAVRLDRRAAEVPRRAGQGPQGQQRQERRHPRPLSGRIGRGSRARHQPGARQRRQNRHRLLRARRFRCPAIRSATSRALVADLNAGKVDWLVILNSNPIYSAPADLGFQRRLLDKAKIVAHLGSHYDETGHLAHWHIPAAHYLESWSDARAYDGTVSIVQPMIDPLYGGKSAHDVFQTLLDNPQLSAYEAVRATQKDNIKGDFETGWRKALHAGWIENTAYR